MTCELHFSMGEPRDDTLDLQDYSHAITAEYNDDMPAAFYCGRGRDATLDLHDCMHGINKKHMSTSFKRPEWFMSLKMSTYLGEQ